MVEASPWHCRAYISLVAKELEKSPSRSPAMQNESPSLKKSEECSSKFRVRQALRFGGVGMHAASDRAKTVQKLGVKQRRVLECSWTES